MKNVSSPAQLNSMDESKFLKAENLTIGYHNNKQPSRVGAGINVSLGKAKIVCLLGANGSGKTTLLRTLAGIQKPLAGKVVFADEDISLIAKKELAKRVSLVLTEKPIATNLSVYGILTLGRYPYLDWLGRLTEHDKRIIHASAVAMGIEPHINKNMHQLSDGEQQKVMIARALVQDTSLIILDEPTAYLDMPSRIEIMHLLRKTTKETGRSILLSTHELDLALQIADEIWLMGEGGELFCGTAEDLIIEGIFEKVFHHPNYHFSLETGSFTAVDKKKGKEISLHGEGIIKYWTQRALEREGYCIVEYASRVVSFQVEDANVWYLNEEDISTKFNSIKELLAFVGA